MRVKKEEIVSKIEAPLVVIPSIKKADSENEKLYSIFLKTITTKKLKDDELLLLHYIINTDRNKLMTGWQEEKEIRKIRAWENINDLNTMLSCNYNSALERMEFRGYIEVSAVTSYDNPKEFKLKDELYKHILDLPNEVMEIINEVVKRNKKEADFPF